MQVAGNGAVGHGPGAGKQLAVQLEQLLPLMLLLHGVLRTLLGS